MHQLNKLKKDLKNFPLVSAPELFKSGSQAKLACTWKIFYVQQQTFVFLACTFFVQNA
jgi:hypothetical protein